MQQLGVKQTLRTRRRRGTLQRPARGARRRRRRTGRDHRRRSRQHLQRRRTRASTGEVEKITKSGARPCSSPAPPAPARPRSGAHCTAADPSAAGCSARARWPNERSPRRSAPLPNGTLLTTPELPSAPIRRSARSVLADYRRRFGSEGGTYALYGYEAMTLVLSAIQAAGARRQRSPGRSSNASSPSRDRNSVHRPLLDRAERRNDALALRGRPGYAAVARSSQRAIETG